MNDKSRYLEKAKNHIIFVVDKIERKLTKIKEIANQDIRIIRKMSSSDQAVFLSVKENAINRVKELMHLKKSPYFMKCIIMDENNIEKDYYFAKHEFSEESIYSWVAPVSSIRFEKPGKVSYMLPGGAKRNIYLKQKDTFMIVDGKIVLLTVEPVGESKRLIYQEHFTQIKKEFILPEIVEQMEKTQDQVIRADYKGPLIISGPAGSGKTTLALHRVAYLTQIPDTAKLFPFNSILILVQDLRTKDYFSALLPSLGINSTLIETFSEWAMDVLQLKGYVFAQSEIEEDENLLNQYEFQKIKVLREAGVMKWYGQDVFSILSKSYASFITEDYQKLFNNQKKEKRLDRFDLMILLEAYFKKYKKFEIKRKYKTFVKGNLVERVEKTPVSYSMIVVDEFQNYLPEQIRMLKNCLDKETKAIVYVGDMGQQVKLGTIRKWEDIDELVLPERNIKLEKVYRNTENILSFIKKLGYRVELPKNIKKGPEVAEIVFNTAKEEIEYIKNLLKTHRDWSVGVLAKDENYLSDFKLEFGKYKNIHVLSMLESQGVEFDLVCIVGVSKNNFNFDKKNLSQEQIKETVRINRDLLYVALSRAINELHIIGSEKLSHIMKELN